MEQHRFVHLLLRRRGVQRFAAFPVQQHVLGGDVPLGSPLPAAHAVHVHRWESRVRVLCKLEVLADVANVHRVLRHKVLRRDLPNVHVGAVPGQPVRACNSIHLHRWSAQERVLQQLDVLRHPVSVLLVLRLEQLQQQPIFMRRDALPPERLPQHVSLLPDDAVHVY